MADTMDRPAGRSGPATVTHWSVFRGLLWRHWLAGRWLILWAVGIWLAGLWALELFFHPGFILAFGAVYAVLAGPLVGASEAAEGSEEFAFSLPPTRGMRYLAALVMAVVPLLALTGLGVLAIAGDWPQALWGLVVDSGFTKPFPAEDTTFLYPLAVALPLAALAFSFAYGALATSRAVAAPGGIAGLGAAAAVMTGGFAVESLLWGDLNGVVSVAALLVLGAGALEAGYLLYLRKEGVSRPAPLGGHRLWTLWLVVPAAVALVLAVATVGWHRYRGQRQEALKAESMAHPAAAVFEVSSPATSGSAPADANGPQGGTR